MRRSEAERSCVNCANSRYVWYCDDCASPHTICHEDGTLVTEFTFNGKPCGKWKEKEA